MPRAGEDDADFLIDQGCSVSGDCDGVLKIGHVPIMLGKSVRSVCANEDEKQRWSDESAIRISSDYNS
jgi:hypothetical protein